MEELRFDGKTALDAFGSLDIIVNITPGALLGVADRLSGGHRQGRRRLTRPVSLLVIWRFT